jgi:hypothetical protein
MVDIVPIQIDVHSRLKINDSNMAHVSDQQVIPILFQEFLTASRSYPIVFVKNVDTGRFQSVCVLGIKSGENKFVKNDKWVSGYVPQIVKNAPFYLIADESEPNRLHMGVDETSARIDLDEGELLFDAEGKETEYIIARKNDLVSYLESEAITKNIIDLIGEMDLLIHQHLSVQLNGEGVDIKGVYIIDEDKLNQLGDSHVLTLHKNGLLAPIYAHLMSLHKLTYVAAFSA